MSRSRQGQLETCHLVSWLQYNLGVVPGVADDQAGDVVDDVPEVVSLLTARSCEGRQGYSAQGQLYIWLGALRALNSTQSRESAQLEETRQTRPARNSLLGWRCPP